MTTADLREIGLDVSRETIDRLEHFAGLIRRWSPRINLVSASTLDALWSRHILDSAQIYRLAPGSARSWADLGSGAGLPGLVIAILAAERNPGLAVHLVESDKRKAVFLRTVIRETGIRASVHAERAETLAPLNADVVSARALAPLETLLDLAERHLAPGGVALFPKGAAWRSEVDSALAQRRFRCDDIPSVTAPDAVILKIGDIARV